MSRKPLRDRRNRRIRPHIPINIQRASPRLDLDRQRGPADHSKGLVPRRQALRRRRQRHQRDILRRDASADDAGGPGAEPLAPEVDGHAEDCREPDQPGVHAQDGGEAVGLDPLGRLERQREADDELGRGEEDQDGAMRLVSILVLPDCTSMHGKGYIRVYLPGVTWIALQQESLHRHKDTRIPPAEKEPAKEQQDTRHARDPVGDVSVQRCTGEHQGARKDDIQKQCLGLAAAAPALGEPFAEAVAQQAAHKPGEGPGDDDGDARQADQRERPARGQ